MGGPHRGGGGSSRILAAAAAAPDPPDGLAAPACLLPCCGPTRSAGCRSPALRVRDAECGVRSAECVVRVTAGSCL
eukprot:scaffold3768_cov376-Prasinococcus_capsulatus_cf.AAC.37